MANPQPPAWTAIPSTPNEWPLARPAPSKTAFATFLEHDLGITDPSRQSGLWSAIAFSAQWLLADAFKRPDNKTLRRRLTQLEGHANKLLQALTEPADGPSPSSTPSPSAEVDFWLWRLLSNAETPSSNELADTQTQLKQFKQLIENSKAALKETSTGRRKDETLWTWVYHLTPLWTLYSDLPVTVDYHQGKPVTPYTVFMHKAVQMLDPERDSKLASVLDRYRTLQNRPKNSPNITE